MWNGKHDLDAIGILAYANLFGKNGSGDDNLGALFRWMQGV